MTATNSRFLLLALSLQAGRVAFVALWSNDQKPMARTIDRYCRVIFPIAFVVLIVTSLIR